MRDLVRGVIVLLAAAVLSAAASAGSIQKFDVEGNGGTIQYTEGPGNPFMADAVLLTLQNVTMSGPKLTILGGMLDLATGGCISSGNRCYTPNGNDQLVLSFAPSGPNTVVASGGVNFSGANSIFDIPAGSNLFTGSLIKTGATLNGKTGKGGLSGEIVVSSINLDLLKGLGLIPGNTSNPQQSIAQLNFTFTSALGGLGTLIGGLGNTITSRITNTDFTIDATPEPTSLLLFGSGILIAAGALRRKLAVRSAAL